MKTNLINALYNFDTITSESDKKRMLKTIINGLTAATCSAMMSHCSKKLRGTNTPSDDDLQDLADHFNGVDGRNEQDAIEAGNELRRQSMIDNGYDVDITPYEVARMADGIRFELYKEVFRFHTTVDYDDAEGLIYTPVRPIDSAINWDQPMSAQMYMDMRVKLAGQVNDFEVKQILRTRKTMLEATVREILQEQAIKNRKRLMELAPEIITEIASLECVYDIDAFTSLPTVVQTRVAQYIERSLTRDFNRMLPASIRNHDLSSECDLIEHELKTVRDFINAAEHAARLDSQKIAA